MSRTPYPAWLAALALGGCTLINSTAEFEDPTDSGPHDAGTTEDSGTMPSECVSGESRDCGTDEGECTVGTQNCVAGAWSDCSGTPPSPDRCNGLDDDCNGTVDDGTVDELGCFWLCVGGVCEDPSQVDVGRNHTCAVTSLSGVVCWGDDRDGQSGQNNSAGDLRFPRRVPDEAGVATLTDVLQVATGHSHTCALTSAGEVLCWGNNTFGQLGTGRLTSIGSRPVGVVDTTGTGRLTGVEQISAAGNFTCARLGDERVVCWGENYRGSLGNGTLDSNPTPQIVVGLGGTGELSLVREIDVAENHACARRSNGQVACWGDNASCQLGVGFCDGRELTPRLVVGPGNVGQLEGIVSISAGTAATCAVSASSELYCWGTAGQGRLGDGNGGAFQRGIPELALGLTGPEPLAGVSRVTTGIDHTCAQLSSGALHCFGSNEFGLLGRGDRDSDIHARPTSPPALSSAESAAGNWNHMCAITSEGELLCWGANLNAQLGDGTTMLRTSPIPVMAPR